MSHQTQFHNIRGAEVCELVVGLDFGTSCTKIVLRDPYRRRRAFAVPFDDSAAHSSSQYLLPSVLWVDEEGVASLAKVERGCHLRDIKYHLMQGEQVPAIAAPEGDRVFDTHAIAVAYLALALQATRGWFLRQHRMGYGKHKLDWQVNLGLPSADFADQPLCADYLRIAAAAWQLSLTDGPIQIEAAESAYLSATVDSETDRTSVGGYVDCGDGRSATLQLIPEVAAEVVGYARSHMREEGLHVLMDIGATTLDVCGFILHEQDDEDCYELLTADVQELGAMVLYRKRVSGMRESVTRHVDGLWDGCDPVSPIPENVNDYLPEKTELLDGLETSDGAYRKLCSQMLFKTLLSLKKDRDPHSRRWKEHVPLFVAGGASQMPFYNEAIGEISKSVRKIWHPCEGIDALPLTKPDGLEADVNDEGFNRLAVAWGLSYPETDIGDVTRPGDIANIAPRRERNRDHLFVGKEST